MKILKLSKNSYEENCYLIVEKGLVTIIDPGFNYEKITEYLTSNNLELDKILLTHGHIDHTGDMDKIVKAYPNTKIYISEFDVPLLFDASLNCSKQMGASKVYKENLNVVPVHNLEEIDSYKFYLTPGHTKGSSIIEKGNFLFTGDTLFKGTVGRVDLPTGNSNDLDSSLDYIKKTFSKSFKILPGHYDYSTIKEELKNNPYLKRKKK